MKSIFAVIGFVVCCLWAYHWYNVSPSAKHAVSSAADTTWNITSPYLNNAVNKAQSKTK